MSETPAIYDQSNAAILETVLVKGDLSGLSAVQRVVYYRQVCEGLELNPLTRPFDYLMLNGKLVLYARKEATDQLRNKRCVSITKLERESSDGIYIVTAYAADKTGRTDSSIGAVSIEGLKGDNRANAIMKAETKAKRRVTLSLCGLGMLDETEIESIPDARPVQVSDAGEIVPATTPAALNAAIDKKAPTRNELLAQLTKAEQAFEAAGLIYTHTDQWVEEASNEMLAQRIQSMREQYANRGQAAPAEQGALV